MTEYETLLRRYFDAWLQKDVAALTMLFEPDVVYSECYGPEYRGLNQILRWFQDWNQQGTVLKWEIKGFIERNNVLAAEWYFCCEYDHVIDGFDGVSIVEFSERGKIRALREFQSKAEHHFPYGES